MMKTKNKSIGGPNITLLVQILEKNLLTIQKTLISSRYVCLNIMNSQVFSSPIQGSYHVVFCKHVFVVSSIHTLSFGLLETTGLLMYIKIDSYKIILSLALKI